MARARRLGRLSEVLFMAQLSSSPCVIRSTAGKGRGLYASRTIPRQTEIEISPVLFFSKEEYAEHGKFTVLDEYTFKWADGRMALALGLGSLFNHSEVPNVSYTLDTSTDSIRYTTTRDIAAEEELCIFYGHTLWFTPAGFVPKCQRDRPEEEDDVWGAFAGNDNPYADGNADDVIDNDDDLPFVRYKLPPDEEDLDSIRTIEAWAVDIPDPRHINSMLKWLKHASLETPDLAHLKRIRKQNNTTSLVLATLATSPLPPTPPPELELLPPYTVLVPSGPALTPVSLKLKSTFWPTLFTPPRKGESEHWTRGRARWAWDAMQSVMQAAEAAQQRGELPIAAHVAPLYDPLPTLPGPPLSFTAVDTRKSNNHPLRHAVMNVIRQVADYRAATSQDSPPPLSEPTTVDPDPVPNGSNYLLTSLTLFTTHEPCIMCSMALIHSRVKEVVFLHPMPRTGGCGGGVCLPTLKGVNHRFGILFWKNGTAVGEGEGLRLEESIDA